MASHEHPHGGGSVIMRILEDRTLSVDIEPLKILLEHPDVKNRKVVALSIVGAYRRGKSFFLNYCLRFMYANVRHFKLFYDFILFYDFLIC
jgi:hypothetical protein